MMIGLHSNYRFAYGLWVKSSPPAWFAKATAKGDDWHRLLTKAGATIVEDFGGDGGADSIQIYQGPAGDYAILFRDCNKCIAKVFIDTIPDYLNFRASVIAPQAALIMESERHYDWQKGKRITRAAS